MRVIAPKRLKEFWTLHPEAEGPLKRWLRIAECTVWQDSAELRRTFPHADLIEVASGNRVWVFNVGGNNFRLVTAIHFDRGRVFILRILTHAEYDTGRWKEGL